MAIRHQYQYPLTPEQKAATVMLGGKLPDERLHPDQDRMTRLNRMYGSGDLDLVARNPAAPGVVPWAHANRNKREPLFDKDAVRDALAGGRGELTPAEPRQLHATQPGITRGGVDYYLNDETYAETGETFADQGNVGNAQPVVFRKADGRNILLSGHHRAAAALLKGEQFNALHVRDPAMGD